MSQTKKASQLGCFFVTINSLIKANTFSKIHHTLGVYTGRIRILVTNLEVASS